MSSLELSIWFLIFTITSCFLLGLLTRNYSYVDRLWSILPPVLALIWLPEFISNWTYIIPTILITIWGARLTYNFRRRGGYKWEKGKGFTVEDYRWPILKEEIKNRFLFEIFNFVFICTFQLVLIFMITLPLYFIGKASHEITWIDLCLYIIFLGLLTIEYIADEQQFNYHSAKTKKGPKDARFKLGFNTYGLWKYSRHPNYFGEMGQWVTIYLMLVSATREFHWSGIGAFALMTLFFGSTFFTEQITRSKYPEYELWQKATPVVVPFITAGLRKKYRRIFWKKLQ